jgi:hypothetical protein
LERSLVEDDQISLLSPSGEQHHKPCRATFRRAGPERKKALRHLSGLRHRRDYSYSSDRKQERPRILIALLQLPQDFILLKLTGKMLEQFACRKMRSWK